MTLSDAAVGTALKPTTFQWDQTDVILYALGVGARPPAELALLNEASRARCAADVRAHRQLVGRQGSPRRTRPRSVPDRALRASLRLDRPIGASGEVTVKAEVTAVWDKGKHAAIEQTAVGTDSEGVLFSACAQTMVLVAAGSGGSRGPAASDDPQRAPDGVYVDVIRPEQAAIYRLSGDRNPLHIDAETARKFGFDALLHGLCTLLDFAARALINVAGNPRSAGIDLSRLPIRQTGVSRLRDPHRNLARRRRGAVSHRSGRRRRSGLRHRDLGTMLTWTNDALAVSATARPSSRWRSTCSPPMDTRRRRSSRFPQSRWCCASDVLPPLRNQGRHPVRRLWCPSRRSRQAFSRIGFNDVGAPSPRLPMRSPRAISESAEMFLVRARMYHNVPALRADDAADQRRLDRPADRQRSRGG